MLYIDEQPLDLSKKSNSQPSIYSENNNFNFEEFYRTYLAISVRSWSTYQQSLYIQSSIERPLEPSANVRSVKRKLANDFDQIPSNKGGKMEKSIDSRINKILRTRKKEEISQIQNSCDCKLCYENHINNLRGKSEFKL